MVHDHNRIYIHTYIRRCGTEFEISQRSPKGGKLVVQCTVIAYLWKPFKPKHGPSSIINSIGKSLPAKKNHSSPLVDSSPLVPVYYSCISESERQRIEAGFSNQNLKRRRCIPFTNEKAQSSLLEPNVASIFLWTARNHDSLEGLGTYSSGKLALTWLVRYPRCTIH